MWPFKKKPDTRPATPAAHAVVKSLINDSARWKINPRNVEELIHDSGIVIGTDGFCYEPNLWCGNEPEANSGLVAAAVDAWVAKMMVLPPQEPAKQEYPDTNQEAR